MNEDDLLIGWNDDYRVRNFHRIEGYGAGKGYIDAHGTGMEHTTTHREAAPPDLQACRRCFPHGYRSWLLAKLADKAPRR